MMAHGSIGHKAMQVAPVVFDLDGTLVDSAESYFLADQRVLALHGIEHGRDADPPFGSGNREVQAHLVPRYRLAPRSRRRAPSGTASTWSSPLAVRSTRR